MPTPGAAPVLIVALLQMGDHHHTTTSLKGRLAAVTPMLQQAKQGGADIAALPAGWEVSEEAAMQYAATAKELAMAIAVPYTTKGTSTALLFSMTGETALSYSVRAGTEAEPTCGDTLNATTVLTTVKGPVTIGVMLDTEHMYMQPARVQMVRGTELLLNHIRKPGGVDPNDPFFQALTLDNYLYYAHVNYATVDGAPAGGSGGGRGEQSAANATEQIVFAHVDVGEIRASRLTAGMWANGTDFLSRRPFNYQPLCYKAAREALDATPVQTVTTRNGDGPVVRVAMLQMNAVAVPDGTDPVQAHIDRATMFVKLAKAKGADVVVFPEQWSIGYSRNYAENHYEDPDSWTTVYGSYIPWAQKKDGAFIQHFQELAKSESIAIAAAYTENVNDTPEPGDVQPPRNSVALIDRTGTMLYNYAKVHIAYSGRTGDGGCEGLTQPGRSFHTKLLDLGDGRGTVSVCSFICFDREHPESAAMCAAGGAELVLHPTACNLPMSYIRKLQARALSNGISIAMANFGNSTYSTRDSWGHSVGINATGDVVTLAPDVPVPTDPGLQVGEGVFISDFDIGAQRAYRESVRGKALTTHPLMPELCKVPLASAYMQGAYDIARNWL